MNQLLFGLSKVDLISGEDAFEPGNFLQSPQGEFGKRDSGQESHGLVAFSGQYILSKCQDISIFRQGQKTDDDLLGAGVMSWSLCQGNRVEPDEDQMGFTSWGSFYKDFGHIPSFSAHVFGEKRLSKAVFGITSNYLIVPKAGQYFLSPLFFHLREGEDVSLTFWLRCQPHPWGQDENQKEEAGVPWEGLNQDR